MAKALQSSPLQSILKHIDNCTHWLFSYTLHVQQIYEPCVYQDWDDLELPMDDRIQGSCPKASLKHITT